MQVEPVEQYAPFLAMWARHFGVVIRGSGPVVFSVTAARDRANRDEQAMLTECVEQLARVRRVKAWLEGG